MSEAASIAFEAFARLGAFALGWALAASASITFARRYFPHDEQPEIVSHSLWGIAGGAIALAFA